MKIHPDILAVHAEFGGDLETMQKLYDYEDLKSERDTLLEKLTATERERDALRSAIFGSVYYDPTLRNGNFIEMARSTEDARKAALDRAEAAERERDDLLAALKPFADEAETWADFVSDRYRPLVTEPKQKVPTSGARTRFTIGNLRKARRLAERKGGE